MSEKKHTVRIVNDGKPGWATKITDADTGEEIPYIMKVELTLDANRRARPVALLTVGYPVVDVIVDAEIRHVCPVCGKPKDEA